MLGRKRAWYLTSSAARGRTAGLGAGAALLSGRFLRGIGPPAEEEAAAPGLLELELLSAILVRCEAWLLLAGAALVFSAGERKEKERGGETPVALSLD